jgi:hypothetical protein
MIGSLGNILRMEKEAAVRGIGEAPIGDRYSLGELDKPEALLDGGQGIISGDAEKTMHSP